jgi:hypothetical protein
MRSVIDLVEDIPVIQSFAAGCGFVVADDHVAGAVKLLQEIPLGIKNDHHVVVGKAGVYPAEDLEKRVRFARADTADEHYMTAQDIGIDRDIRTPVFSVGAGYDVRLRILYTELIERDVPAKPGPE